GNPRLGFWLYTCGYAGVRLGDPQRPLDGQVGGLSRAPGRILAHLTIARGLVHAVACTWQFWAANSSALLGHCPLRGLGSGVWLTTWPSVRDVDPGGRRRATQRPTREEVLQMLANRWHGVRFE